MVTCIRRGCLEGKPPLENCELCKVDLERGALALEPGKKSQVEKKGRCNAVPQSLKLNLVPHTQIIILLH